MPQLLLAASTQRTIGLVIAILVALGFAAYVIANIFIGRKEIGSEIELAPNRKPYYDDAELETKRLDRSLAAGVGTLAVISLALPLYWLGEPGRQEGRDDFTVGQFERRGEGLYEELCAQCHGAAGVGGGAAYTLLDDSGRFVTSSTWTAPALNNILYRFDIDEVTHILNYGRPQSPMPAWGGPGGGPLTSQQLEEIIEYLKVIQLGASDMEAEVTAGLRAGVINGVREANFEATQVIGDEAASDADKAAAEDTLTAAFNSLVPPAGDDPGLGDALNAATAIAADPDATIEDIDAANVLVDTLLDGYLDTLAESDVAAYGELLFNNTAGAGSYNCARCHTAGSSWDANSVLQNNPALVGLVSPEVPGGGGFGPSLLGVESQFSSAASQSAFISAGCDPASPTYGLNGVCEPAGQMPGFGPGATDFVALNAAEGDVHQMLSPEQIAAIVEYERGLE